MAVDEFDKMWMVQQRKLSKETQTRIKRSKLELTPDLEKYAKVSGFCRKDLDADAANAKTGKLFDAARKLEKQIHRACDDFLGIVDSDNTKEERNAEKLLKRIRKDVETDFLQIKKQYVAVTGS